MVYCSRCQLNNAVRVVNLALNYFGMGMIIYSLWLLKLWREGIVGVGFSTSPSKPWFIYTLLCLGIVVCFSAILGHMVSNCITTAALLIYIVIIGSIIFLQILVIVAILFKIDWRIVIRQYLNGKHVKLENVLCFHLNVCRFIGAAILLPQIKVLVLATILWVLGPEPRNHCRPVVHDSRHSFLVVDSLQTTPASVPPFLTRFRV